MRSLLGEGGEWLAISQHTESYPSGDSATYATYAYFDGQKLRTGGQSLTLKWERAQFYKIDRADEE